MGKAIDSKELLERVDGDYELLSELLDSFRQDYPGQIQLVRQALTRSDLRGIEHGAHSLKGTLANLSANAASRLAGKLEEMGRSGHLAQANSTLAELEQELSRVIVSLGILCEGMSSEDTYRGR